MPPSWCASMWLPRRTIRRAPTPPCRAPPMVFSSGCPATISYSLSGCRSRLIVLAISVVSSLAIVLSPLPSFPLRLALLGEGAWTLLGILGAEELVVEMTGEGSERRFTHIHPTVGQLLEIAHRQRRILGDLPRQGL